MTYLLVVRTSIPENLNVAVMISNSLTQSGNLVYIKHSDSQAFPGILFDHIVEISVPQRPVQQQPANQNGQTRLNYPNTQQGYSPSQQVPMGGSNMPQQMSIQQPNSQFPPQRPVPLSSPVPAPNFPGFASPQNPQVNTLGSTPAQAGNIQSQLPVQQFNNTSTPVPGAQFFPQYNAPYSPVIQNPGAVTPFTPK